MTAALNVKRLPDPDLYHFDTVVYWCHDGTTATVKSGTSYSTIDDSWFVSLLYGALSIDLDYEASTTVIGEPGPTTSVVSRGTFRGCVNPVDLAATFAPFGKVVSKLGAGLAKIAAKHGGLATARAVTQALREVEKFRAKGLHAAVQMEKFLERNRVPGGAADLLRGAVQSAWNQAMNRVANEIRTGGAAFDAVMDMLGFVWCGTLWEPVVRVTLSPNGSVPFVTSPPPFIAISTDVRREVLGD